MNNRDALILGFLGLFVLAFLHSLDLRLPPPPQLEAKQEWLFDKSASEIKQPLSATQSSVATNTTKSIKVKHHGLITNIIVSVAKEKLIDVKTFLRFAAIETGNSFNHLAFNKGSKAKGLFQFIPSTAELYGISGREEDPYVNTEAAARLYLDNRRDLAQYNIPETAANMYLAHQQGVTGLIRLHIVARGERGFKRHYKPNGKLESDERLNLLSNSPKSWRNRYKNMTDQEIALFFLQAWERKFNAVDISKVITDTPITKNEWNFD